jgi:hypothetical protein
MRQFLQWKLKNVVEPKKEAAQAAQAAQAAMEARKHPPKAAPAPAQR